MTAQCTTIKYRVTHQTEYVYKAPVTLGHNEVHLKPRQLPKQQCLAFDLDITPEPAVLHSHEDFFGNPAHYFSIQKSHTTLLVGAVSSVTVSSEPPPPTTMPWDSVVNHITETPASPCLEARQYVLDSPRIVIWPELLAYARPSFPPGRPLLEAVHELMERIHREFTYDPDFTTVTTPLPKVFKHRRGVCQDFAHLAIACLRGLGLAARYVSGYIETSPPPGKEKLVGTDASHAWFSVFEPEVGWMDFDPTNNQIPMAQHITVAWGRDYSDITPLKGVIYGGGSSHGTWVAVDVQRLA